MRVVETGVGDADRHGRAAGRCLPGFRRFDSVDVPHQARQRHRRIRGDLGVAASARAVRRQLWRRDSAAFRWRQPLEMVRRDPRRMRIARETAQVAPSCDHEGLDVGQLSDYAATGRGNVRPETAEVLVALGDEDPAVGTGMGWASGGYGWSSGRGAHDQHGGRGHSHPGIDPCHHRLLSMGTHVPTTTRGAVSPVAQRGQGDLCENCASLPTACRAHGSTWTRRRQPVRWPMCSLTCLGLKSSKCTRTSVDGVVVGAVRSCRLAARDRPESRPRGSSIDPVRSAGRARSSRSAPREYGAAGLVLTGVS